VKYAGACEIACGSEIRLRRVEERISFHILLNKVKQDISQFPKEIISHSPSGEYFTFFPRVLKNTANCAIINSERRWRYEKTNFCSSFICYLRTIVFFV
jgi:hypothetical protein